MKSIFNKIKINKLDIQSIIMVKMIIIMTMTLNKKNFMKQNKNIIRVLINQITIEEDINIEKHTPINLTIKKEAYIRRMSMKRVKNRDLMKDKTQNINHLITKIGNMIDFLQTSIIELSIKEFIVQDPKVDHIVMQLNIQLQIRISQVTQVKQIVIEVVIVEALVIVIMIREAQTTPIRNTSIINQKKSIIEKREDRL